MSCTARTAAFDLLPARIGLQALRRLVVDAREPLEAGNQHLLVAVLLPRARERDQDGDRTLAPDRRARGLLRADPGVDRRAEVIELELFELQRTAYLVRGPARAVRLPLDARDGFVAQPHVGDEPLPLVLDLVRVAQLDLDQQPAHQHGEDQDEADAVAHEPAQHVSGQCPHQRGPLRTTAEGAVVARGPQTFRPANAVPVRHEGCAAGRQPAQIARPCATSRRCPELAAPACGPDYLQPSRSVRRTRRVATGPDRSPRSSRGTGAPPSRRSRRCRRAGRSFPDPHAAGLGGGQRRALRLRAERAKRPPRLQQRHGRGLRRKAGAGRRARTA